MPLDDLLDDGTDLARRLQPHYIRLLEQAWDDAESAGLVGSFDLENEYVQGQLSALAKLITRITDESRAQVREVEGRAAREGWAVEQRTARYKEVFETWTTTRAEMVARTESATAYTKGSIAAYEASGEVAGIEWLLGPEPCDQCKAYGGKVAPLGKAFAAGIDHPPLHPRCTCAVIPVLKALAEDRVEPFASATDADKWGRETYGEWRATLTEDEEQEIKLYQSSEYRRINAALRNGDELDDDDRETVVALDRVLGRKPLDHDIISYRGMTHPDLIKNFDSLVGTEITDMAFVSTSLDPAQGARFMRFAAEDGVEALVAEIRIPKGSGGAYIEGVLNLNEYEFLLPRGLRFRVTGTSIDNDVRKVMMEVIAE